MANAEQVTKQSQPKGILLQFPTSTAKDLLGQSYQLHYLLLLKLFLYLQLY